MNVTITARKFKARDSLKSFITKELNTLKKFNDDIMHAEVILSYQHPKNSIKSAEIILHLPGQMLNAAEDSDDFKKSVSSSIVKLERQLKRLKSKRISNRV